MDSLTVWKFPFEVADEFEVSMPRGAQVLHVEVQRENPSRAIPGDEFWEREVPCMWALCNPGGPRELRRFRLAGTGHPIDPRSVGAHVGTFVMRGGALVWHVFEAAR